MAVIRSLRHEASRIDQGVGKSVLFLMSRTPNTTKGVRNKALHHPLWWIYANGNRAAMEPKNTDFATAGRKVGKQAAHARNPPNRA